MLEAFCQPEALPMLPGQQTPRSHQQRLLAGLVLTHRFGSCLMACAAAVRVSASSSLPGSSVECSVLGLAGGWSKGSRVCSTGALGIARGCAGRSSAQAELCWRPLPGGGRTTGTALAGPAGSGSRASPNGAELLSRAAPEPVTLRCSCLTSPRLVSGGTLVRY